MSLRVLTLFFLFLPPQWALCQFSSVTYEAETELDHLSDFSATLKLSMENWQFNAGLVLVTDTIKLFGLSLAAPIFAVGSLAPSGPFGNLFNPLSKDHYRSRFRFTPPLRPDDGIISKDGFGVGLSIVPGSIDFFVMERPRFTNWGLSFFLRSAETAAVRGVVTVGKNQGSGIDESWYADSPTVPEQRTLHGLFDIGLRTALFDVHGLLMISSGEYSAPSAAGGMLLGAAFGPANFELIVRGCEETYIRPDGTPTPHIFDSSFTINSDLPIPLHLGVRHQYQITRPELLSVGFLAVRESAELRVAADGDLFALETTAGIDIHTPAMGIPEAGSVFTGKIVVGDQLKAETSGEWRWDNAGNLSSQLKGKIALHISRFSISAWAAVVWDGPPGMEAEIKLRTVGTNSNWHVKIHVENEIESLDVTFGWSAITSHQ